MSLEDIVCWKEWESPDSLCGKDGIKYWTKFADCSAVKSLSKTCNQRFKADVAQCVDYQCTKLSIWGTWSGWSQAVKCGNSTRRRTRNCIYKQRSVETWKDISCNSTCFQCIENADSQVKCSDDNCERSGCYAQNFTQPAEFHVTLRCEGGDSTGARYLDNIDIEEEPIQCGEMNPWTEWSRCGITCGYKWGKRYRSHTCLLSAEEEASDICSSVRYFHIQPEWCLEKLACPERRQITRLFPKRKKVLVEGKNAVVIVSGVSVIFFGLIGSLLVLDFPYLMTEMRRRLTRNLLDMDERPVKKKSRKKAKFKRFAFQSRNFSYIQDHQ